MQRLLEFVSNHPLLWTALAVLIIAWVVLELRLRAKGSLDLGSFEFTRQLNTGTALLLDLRSTAEFEKGHIHGARQMTPTQVDPGAKELSRYKEGGVLLYCQNGLSSGETAEKLLKAGYARVFSLKGGIATWLQDQLPLERGRSR